MSQGVGPITYSSPSGAQPPFVNLKGARNGLSVDVDNYVVLGQDAGDPGNVAQFINEREIPQNSLPLTFIDTLNTDADHSSIIHFDSVGAGGRAHTIVANGNGSTDQSGNNAYFQVWQTANYGVIYPSNFAPGDQIRMDRFYMGYILQNSGDNAGITGMPDCVWGYGYNVTTAWAQVNNLDAAYSFRNEGHFINSLEGQESNFEFHRPAVVVFDGTEFRINSYYVDKTNALTLNNRTIDTTVFYSALENIGAQNKPYFEYSRVQDGAQITFLKASSLDQNVGLIRIQSGVVGAIATELSSFGQGDFQITDISRGTNDQWSTNGDRLFNQENSIYPAQSRGILLTGNINTFNYTRNAQLAVYSTTRGLLLPNMTTTQRLAIPVTPADQGLIVSDSTLLAPFYYDGTTWHQFTLI